METYNSTAKNELKSFELTQDEVESSNKSPKNHMQITSNVDENINEKKSCTIFGRNNLQPSSDCATFTDEQIKDSSTDVLRIDSTSMKNDVTNEDIFHLSNHAFDGTDEIQEIPCLEENYDDFKASNNFVPKIPSVELPTLEELDSKLPFPVSSWRNGIDLTVLTKHLIPPNAVSCEDDIAWNFDSLLQEIKHKIKEESSTTS